MPEAILTMNQTGTILLTSGDARLVSALREALPGVAISISGSRLPERRIEGRIWCFVDWLLPETSGLELCRRLRDAAVTAHSHITMVLDEDDSEARRRALRAGADDYMLGPLTAARLAERIQQYRPVSPLARPAEKLTHGALSVDLTAHQARWQGKVIALRPNEFRLLAHFVEHPDHVFPRTSLIAMLGKDSEALDERTVDVWVGRLRRALKAYGVPDPLRTVRSMGYVLDSIEEAPLRAAS